MKTIFLGLGGRGRHYLEFALQEDVEIAAICDSDPDRLELIIRELDLAHVPAYLSADEALAETTDAEACVISLPDPLHHRYTLMALERYLHVLLEKPMALSKEHSIEMVEASEKYDKELILCHVLRYAPMFEKVKEMIDSGIIGDVMNIELTENVAWWHYAHSYVRGIFKNTDSSAPFLLAKSSHDLDLIVYFTGKRCVSVMSEGGLFHFREENAPEGAPARCLDGCPHEKTCPYFAPAFYLRQFTQVGWPSNRIAKDDSYNARLEALRTTDFGRCVYRSDNNVFDHQACLFVMEDGSTATFNLSGLASENTRTFRVFGTKGDLTGHLDNNELVHGDYLSKERKKVNYETAETVMSSHGGGDARLFREFVDVVKGRKKDSKSSARLSLQSHLMAFAAEESARTGQRVFIVE